MGVEQPNSQSMGPGELAEQTQYQRLVASENVETRGQDTQLSPEAFEQMDAVMRDRQIMGYGGDKIPSWLQGIIQSNDGDDKDVLVFNPNQMPYVDYDLRGDLVAVSRFLKDRNVVTAYTLSKEGRIRRYSIDEKQYQPDDSYYTADESIFANVMREFRYPDDSTDDWDEADWDREEMNPSPLPYLFVAPVSRRKQSENLPTKLGLKHRNPDEGRFEDIQVQKVMEVTNHSPLFFGRFQDYYGRWEREGSNLQHVLGSLAGHGGDEETFLIMNPEACAANGMSPETIADLLHSAYKAWYEAQTPVQTKTLLRNGDIHYFSSRDVEALLHDKFSYKGTDRYPVLVAVSSAHA